MWFPSFYCFLKDGFNTFRGYLSVLSSTPNYVPLLAGLCGKRA